MVHHTTYTWAHRRSQPHHSIWKYAINELNTYTNYDTLQSASLLCNLFCFLINLIYLSSRQYMDMQIDCMLLVFTFYRRHNPLLFLLFLGCKISLFHSVFCCCCCYFLNFNLRICSVCNAILNIKFIIWVLLNWLCVFHNNTLEYSSSQFCMRAHTHTLILMRFNKKRAAAASCRWNRMMLTLGKLN